MLLRLRTSDLDHVFEHACAWGSKGSSASVRARRIVQGVRRTGSSAKNANAPAVGG